MTSERNGAAHSRRGFLKGVVGAGMSAAAVAALGGDLIAPGMTVSAQADEMLPSSKFTIKNTIALNLSKHFTTVPLFQGRFNGQPVWFVLTESSDERMASDMGLNFAPRLANIPAGHPAVQDVTSGNPMLGRDMVTFAGMPDFSATRRLAAGPKGFEPADAFPGGWGMGMYADLVRLRGSNVVFNAPIIAVGAGPFDVTTHTNTGDRVLGIDTGKMTADLLFVRAFAFGQEIMYHNFSVSDPTAASIERSNLVSAMQTIPVMNTRTVQEGARSAILGFANGPLGQTSPPAQGLNHVILDSPSGADATIQNTALLTALSKGADARNILDAWPTLRDPALARLYTPLWSLQVAKWADAAIAAGKRTVVTDSNQIRQLAAQGLVTAPDGLALTEQNIVLNCPALAFTNTNPEAFQAPDPGRAAGATFGAP